MYNLDGCNFTDTTIQLTNVVYFFTFYLLLPYYLTVAQLLHILLIIALSKRVRSKASFAYQLMVVCGKLFENIGYGYFLAGTYWFVGQSGTTATWFTSSYYLVYITTKLLPPASFVGLFLPLLLSVAMAADRVFALWKPMAYRAINHRTTHQCSAFFACLIISVAVSFDKFWSYVVTETLNEDGTISYGLKSNSDYNSAPWGQTSESVRTYVRISLVIGLIILNVIMVKLYQTRMKKLQSMSIPNHEKVLARKEANKDLMVLSIWQSILTCFSQIPNAAGQMLRQQSTYWAKCFMVVAAEYNAAIMLAASAEFFVMLAVNRKLRRDLPGARMIRAVWPNWVNQVGTTN